MKDFVTLSMAFYVWRVGPVNGNGEQGRIQQKIEIPSKSAALTRV